MLLFIIYAVILVILFGTGAAFARNLKKQGKTGREFLLSHPRAFLSFILFFQAFESCFSFPVVVREFSDDISKAYMILVSYGMMGLAYFSLYYEKNSWKKVWAFSFLGTLAGLLCRYLLEYGEVSNTYNFTPLNLAVFLAVIPAYTAAAYRCFWGMRGK